MKNLAYQIGISFLMVIAGAETAFANCSTDVQLLNDKLYKENYSYEAAVEYWRGTSESCKSTGVYYQKLGALYNLNKQRSKAVQTYHEGLALDDDAKPDLMVGIANVYFQAAAAGEAYEENVKQAASEFAKVVRAYPEDAYVLMQYANFLYFIERYDLAFNYAVKSNNIREDYYSLRLIAIIFGEHKNDSENAITTAYRALGMRNNFNTDLELEVVLAHAYMDKGDAEFAAKILQSLKDRRPSIVTEKKFIDALERLRPLYQSSKN
ncbi:hypothetical protein OE749_11585 [Aestuariibacter sp. AA17]|uniref:Tetratricopeptide repeat protein n=1 Tax=Fluctibacter corallii TaxID=2984329 RepID=A0ABT3A9Q8_9ALTE|nr:hypothetical protein [Aestuariibacter sp. AA17]MCV2885335.1 hypothetical protein [Aestuariibacter sp. AA17]